MLVFSNNVDCDKRHIVEFGNPFLETFWWNPNVFTDDDIEKYTNENWNELFSCQPIHPLEVMHFCYSMHILVFDTKEINWQDLADIDEIWLEIKVDYQFFTK